MLEYTYKVYKNTDFIEKYHLRLRMKTEYFDNLVLRAWLHPQFSVMSSDLREISIFNIRRPRAANHCWEFHPLIRCHFFKRRWKIIRRLAGMCLACFDLQPNEMYTNREIWCPLIYGPERLDMDYFVWGPYRDGWQSESINEKKKVDWESCKSTT